MVASNEPMYDSINKIKAYLCVFWGTKAIWCSISDLLNFKTYSRSLRSSCKEYLVVPRSRLKTYGDGAFSIAVPKLWNDLPLEIRKCASVATFKQSLKTFLFKLAYRLWDSFCFEMFLIYIVDNLGYIWIILYIVDILYFIFFIFYFVIR